MMAPMDSWSRVVISASTARDRSKAGRMYRPHTAALNVSSGRVPRDARASFQFNVAQ